MLQALPHLAGRRRAARNEISQSSQALAPLLAKVTAKEKLDQRKSVPWKVKIASHLKATTSVSNAWLAEQLNLGSPFYVSKQIGLEKKVQGKA